MIADILTAEMCMLSVALVAGLIYQPRPTQIERELGMWDRRKPR